MPAKNDAGITEIFNIPSRAYQTGLTSSPTFTFPSGFTEVDADFTMSSTDLQDTSKTMEFRLMVDLNSDGNFTENAGFTWQGGVLSGKPPSFQPPSLAVENAAQLASLSCRVDMILGSPMTIGITVSGA